MKEKLYRNWDFDFKTFNLVKFTYVAENYKTHNLLHLRNLDENIWITDSFQTELYSQFIQKHMFNEF